MMKIRTTRHVVFVCLLLTLLSAKVCGHRCASRSYGVDKTVCVCNADYCDNVHPPERLLRNGHYVQYTSTQTGLRLEPTARRFSKTAPTSGSVWKVNSLVQYQEILGFGAAITDSVGTNLGTLDETTRYLLLEQYYGPKGIGYTFVRSPIGGSDFSPRFYTYNDGDADVKLSRFSLDEEDYINRLPYLKYIKQLSNPKVIMLPWSPPRWMVEARNSTEGYTRLKDEYYQVYAEYFVKFLQAYQEEGIDIWGLTPQNEPENGYVLHIPINHCGFSAEEERTFITNNLGPTLRKNNFENVRIMNGDGFRTSIPNWQIVTMGDPQDAAYVSGTAVHWYMDANVSASRLTELHDLFPDKFILYTEASFIPGVSVPDLNPVVLGDWERVEILAEDILDVLNHWVSGWVDWNLALNADGGPTYLRNYLDSPIIINSTANEFYKQPMFYALAHLSKFVLPGSIRIELTSTADSGIDNVAFLRPDAIVAVVLLNSNDDARSTVLQTDSGKYIPLTLSAHSLNTIIYRT